MQQFSISVFLLLIAGVLTSILAPICFVGNIIRKLALHLIGRSTPFESLTNYFRVVALGFDKLGGAVIYAKEGWTVSSRTGYLSAKGYKYPAMFEKLINMFFGEDHCWNSYCWERDALKLDGEGSRYINPIMKRK